MSTALYTNLSSYYDLMCSDINYLEQARYVDRLHRLLGSDGNAYLDLACGTGPHIEHFLEFGYKAQGVDINQPMLAIARQRCPGASFIQQDMAALSVETPLDLVSCFLYSIHYNNTIAQLQQCIVNVHAALKPGGMFCFNSVDKNCIDNRPGIKRHVRQDSIEFYFQSNWFYSGNGDRQSLQLSIERKGDGSLWRDEHTMVAVSFSQMQALLTPYFDVHIFEHDYGSIRPWNGKSGNAIFVGLKI